MWRSRGKGIVGGVAEYFGGGGVGGKEYLGVGERNSGECKEWYGRNGILGGGGRNGMGVTEHWRGRGKGIVWGERNSGGGRGGKEYGCGNGIVGVGGWGSNTGTEQNSGG